VTAERGSDGGSRPIIPAARAWLAQDPDPETRAELMGLVAGAGTGDGEAAAELAARFAGCLEFGTAGLRAELGAGPMRMNRVVVAQAAAGIAAYLNQRSLSERSETKGPGDTPSAVIGYDGRRNSAIFARDAAEILAGAGIEVALLPRALPTPVLAFAVRHLETSAGIMITASHNPRDDNGMKVYLGGTDAGTQIVPPTDADIAAEIARVAEGSIADLPRSTDYRSLDEAVLDAYVAATAQVVGLDTPLRGTRPATSAAPASAGRVAPEARIETSPLRIAYTAMHGVGLETARRVFAAAGLPELLVVPEQAEPDGDFPTVAFPNPEEPGALDLVLAFATAEHADLIIANDPDADRLAIAVPDAESPAGWRRLTGNDVGLLLGWAAARDAGPTGVLACSLVSSPGLAHIAAHHGLGYAETLTGFKWIARVPGLSYGYEEALGYLVNPGTVRDKDGISAAARFVDLASRWRSEGRTVDDALDEIAAAIGGFASGQVSIRVEDLAVIGRITARLRAAAPTEIAGRRVVGIRDHLDEPHAADILRYDLDDGSRVIVRPSGTEPKLKVYLDARSEAGSGTQRRRAAIEVVTELDAAVRALLG